MKLTNWTVHGSRSLWRRHPAVRDDQELTVGERAADRLRNGMGSWAFVLVSLVFLAGWMLEDIQARLDVGRLRDPS